MKKIVLLFGVFVMILSCVSSPKDESEFHSMRDAVSIEIAEVQFGMKKLIQQDCKTHTAILMYTQENGLYHLMFRNIFEVLNELYIGSEFRKGLMESYELYSVEYENKTLIEEDRNTYKAYGEAESHLRWGTMMINSQSPMKVTFGYSFLDGHPYYTITIPAVENQERGMVNTLERQTLYFTRAEAEELLVFFTDEAMEEIQLYLLEQEDLSTPDEY